MDKKQSQRKAFPRPIRSFVKREGKLTKGQQSAIDELWPQFGIESSGQTLDLAACFGRDAYTVLEIGFGNGLSLVEMAEQHPEQNFVGIEVHTPGVGSLLVQVRKRCLQNIRVLRDDAVQVLEQQIPDSSLDCVQIFFPDPWHKKRHHKRRLIQTDFVDTLAAKLKLGGTLHIATDWENYAEHILEVLTKNVRLQNQGQEFQKETKKIKNKKSRPKTKYEIRGENLGHSVSDFCFKRVL